MKQFWKEDRWVRMTLPDGTYDLKLLKKEMLDHEYDIKIMAGSTMPVNRGAMLDLMIRLAQTQMPDGTTLVDREAVAQYLPQEVSSALLQRMEKGQNQVQQQIAEMQQMVQQLGQGLQQIIQESKANDAQTMEVIEQITGAIEKINQQIVQMQQMDAKMEEDKRMQEEKTKLQSDSYNQGYLDAEKLLASETMEGDGILEGLGEDDNLGLGLPDDILSSIEELSDDELALLLKSNPELADLLE